MVTLYKSLKTVAMRLGAIQEGQIVIKNKSKPPVLLRRGGLMDLNQISNGEHVYYHGSEIGVETLLQDICEKEKAFLETFKVIDKKPKKAIQIKVIYKSSGQDKTISRILKPSL